MPTVQTDTANVPAWTPKATNRRDQRKPSGNIFLSAVKIIASLGVGIVALFFVLTVPYNELKGMRMHHIGGFIRDTSRHAYRNTLDFVDLAVTDPAEAIKTSQRAVKESWAAVSGSMVDLTAGVGEDADRKTEIEQVTFEIVMDDDNYEEDEDEAAGGAGGTEDKEAAEGTSDSALDVGDEAAVGKSVPVADVSDPHTVEAPTPEVVEVEESSRTAGVASTTSSGAENKDAPSLAPTNTQEGATAEERESDVQYATVKVPVNGEQYSFSFQVKDVQSVVRAAEGLCAKNKNTFNINDEAKVQNP